MKNLNIKHLKILLDVVATRSFSQSAKNTGLTQASISKSIAAVEEILGVKIIDREGRPVSLTPFGETLLPYIKKHIAENDELFEFVENYKKAPAGEINIYSPSGMQAYLSVNVLPSLFHHFPDLNVTMTTSNHSKSDYFTGVDFDNSCDILISYSPPKNENLVARKVKRIRMSVFSTPEFYEQHPFTTPEELSQYPFILLSAMGNNGYENKFEFVNSSTSTIKSISVTGKLKFDNIYTAINCCKNGMGYMVTSDILLQDVKGIQPVLSSEWGIYIDCYVIYRNRKTLPFRVQSSLDYIIEIMKDGNDD